MVATRKKGTRERFRATEATRVQQQSNAKKQELAAKKILEEAETKISEVLVAKLKGKGWVPMNTIGAWFNESDDAREALQIIKTKHVQVRSHILSL